MTRRALIVIDVQNEYETGALPIAHPPLAESLPFQPCACRYVR